MGIVHTTALARQVRTLVMARDLEGAAAMLPMEIRYRNESG